MTRSAAQERDPDVVIVQAALIGRDPTELEWESHPPLVALRRIEQRLAAGKAHAAIVDARVKAGHIEAVEDPSVPRSGFGI